MNDLDYLVGGLKYSELNELIGQVVTIQTEASLESDLHAQLRPSIPYLGSIKNFDYGSLADFPGYAHGPWRAWAKYWLLDLKFDVDPAVLHPPGDAIDEQWIFNLFCEIASDDELGPQLLGDPSHKRDFDELKKAVANNRWYVLLFLTDINEGPYTRESIDKRIKLSETMEALESYFPLQFKVTDACLTNTSKAWMSKHFYM